MPRERNPRRPLVTEDRFRKILKVAPRVTMEVYWGEQPQTVPTYLPELLILANGTGRRISAICSLTFADLRLSRGPHGSIRWPADTDKIGLESVVPITKEVREVLDRIQRERPGMGAAPLFPSPKDPGQPIRYELASGWLIEAEKLAGLPKQDGSLWHAFRRKWATERKALPNVDVAAAGGWKSPPRSSRFISGLIRPRCTASSQRGRRSSRSSARPDRRESRSHTPSRHGRDSPGGMRNSPKIEGDDPRVKAGKAGLRHYRRGHYHVGERRTVIELVSHAS